MFDLDHEPVEENAQALRLHIELVRPSAIVRVHLGHPPGDTESEIGGRGTIAHE